eukprot:8381124-Karenia_brevis.AAC.1
MHGSNADHVQQSTGRRGRRAHHARACNGSRIRRKRRAPRVFGSPADLPARHPDFAFIADASAKDEGLWIIDTSNPNSWESAKEHILKRSAADIVAIQETKKVIPSDDPTLVAKSARKIGWNLCASSALALPSGFASGGCAVGATRGIGVAPHEQLIQESFQYRLQFCWIAGIMP